MKRQAMKKKPTSQRYYDIRLVLMFIGLLAFYVGINYIISITLNVPILAEWRQVGPRSWALSDELQIVFSTRVCLYFFEMLFGWFTAALLCGGEEETEGNNVFWWVSSLCILPIIVNFVPNLGLWIAYTLVMIVSGWILGKNTGFILPLKAKAILKSIIDEGTDMKVNHPKYGNFSFPGKSSLIFYTVGMMIPFGLALYCYLSALMNTPSV